MVIIEHTQEHTVRLTGTFKVSSTLTDPSTITFKMKKPNGVITTFIFNTDAELVKDSTGVFYVEQKLDLSGDWYYSFEGTGAVKAFEENRFHVKNIKTITT